MPLINRFSSMIITNGAAGGKSKVNFDAVMLETEKPRAYQDTEIVNI